MSVHADGGPAGDLPRESVGLQMHAGPDISERNATDDSAAIEARAAGTSTIALRSYAARAAARAETASRATGFPIFGGVALDSPLGGVNHHAVVETARRGDKIVWMRRPALGISGGSPFERLRRSLEGLSEVGLSDQELRSMAGDVRRFHPGLGRRPLRPTRPRPVGEPSVGADGSPTADAEDEPGTISSALINVSSLFERRGDSKWR
jgi:Family of unknown function (DUF6282)